MQNRTKELVTRWYLWFSLRLRYNLEWLWTNIVGVMYFPQICKLGHLAGHLTRNWDGPYKIGTGGNHILASCCSGLTAMADWLATVTERADGIEGKRPKKSVIEKSDLNLNPWLRNLLWKIVLLPHLWLYHVGRGRPIGNGSTGGWASKWP